MTLTISCVRAPHPSEGEDVPCRVQPHRYTDGYDLIFLETQLIGQGTLQYVEEVSVFMLDIDLYFFMPSSNQSGVREKGAFGLFRFDRTHFDLVITLFSCPCGLIHFVNIPI